MSVSPFDHVVLRGLLGDAEIALLFSAEAEIGAMLSFGAALAQAEGAEGVIPADAARTIARKLGSAQLDYGLLCESTARDGVVVPELVRQLRALVGDHGHHVHVGATSQDVIDTGLAMRLTTLGTLLDQRLEALLATLDRLDHRFGAVPHMAHTRMQAAIPVTASRKILSWRDPLARHRRRLPAIMDDVAILSFGGAAGTLDRLGDEAHAVARLMAERLGLRLPARPRHSERDGIAALAAWLAMVAGSLGKIGQDVALMAQSEVRAVRLASGGGSSAMPHKVNPVAAEVLVTLARFCATLQPGMTHALVHENERSGAAWTLEWMLLPQLCVATGAALLTAQRLLDGLEFVPLQT